MEESEIVLSKMEELGDAELMIEKMRGVVTLWMESVEQRLSMEKEVEVLKEEKLGKQKTKNGKGRRRRRKGR